MRNAFACLVALCLASPTGAHAGTLSSATWTTGLGYLAPFQPSVGVPISATGTSTSTSVSLLMNVGPTSFTEFSTGPPIPLHLSFAIGGAAGLTATAGGAAATMAIPARATVKFAAHLMGSTLVVQDTTVVKVPLSVGVKGRYVNPYFIILTGPHYLTVDSYAWTPGTVSFTGLTSDYQALPTPTVVAMGSFALDAMGSGMVTLVAPTRLSIDGTLAQRRSVDFTKLTLTFVPEPGSLLLLAAFAASLAVVARGREH